MSDLIIELTRSVRFNISLDSATPAQSPPKHNTFAGWPSMTGIGAHYQLDVSCRGRADAQTGYLMNISNIDKAVREHAIPLIREMVVAKKITQPGDALRQVLSALQGPLQNTIVELNWRLSPYYSVAMKSADIDRVLISEQFEFSASHRLHLDTLDAKQNRELFGKCNNPNGHGHNYVVEPQVSVSLGRPQMSLADVERIVDETIIQRFDHKNLNVDAAEFFSVKDGGVNPSVENIARVCYDLLKPPIAQAGGTLERITVWETPKTKCTYPAGL